MHNPSVNAVILAPAKIGEMFKRAHQSYLDSVGHLIEIGKALAAVKESLPHGDWLLWLKDHQNELGFGVLTAQRLLRLSNTSSTTHLDEDASARLSRQVWGNEPEAPMHYDERSAPYRQLGRFLDWLDKHAPREVNVEMTREEALEVSRRITLAQEWLESLDKAIRGIRTNGTHAVIHHEA